MPVKITTLLICGLVVGNLGAAAPVRAEPVTIIALGDSLTSGYGVAAGAAFPEQLQTALRQRGHDVVVVNAGVSGDTSSGGYSRLDWSVPPEAAAVIVELGANDALRGIDPGITREALTGIVNTLKSRGQVVLLAGMLAPRNLGPEYAEAHEAIFADLGADPAVFYYPFFLDGVAGRPELNQPDGIHPNEEGIATIVERFLPYAERLLEAIAAGQGR